MEKIETYSRICPKCNRNIFHATESSRNWAMKIGRKCRSCSQIGHTVLDESKKKMSSAKIGKPTWSSLHKEEFGKIQCGKNHPMYGKHHTDEMKRKQSERNFGKKLSKEIKRKLRVAAIKQHRKNGIKFPAIDGGSVEYFDNMNKYSGFHIQHPNIEIKDLGYFVDGYDPILHAVFEYDTKTHNSCRYKKKDLERQKEIIEYYKRLGNPLNNFYRINQTGFGKEGMEDVLTTTEDK